MTLAEDNNPFQSNIVHIGGRKSKLAVVQSESIKAKIATLHPDFSIDVLAFSTLGDKVQNVPLYSFGGKSLWTKELEILLMHKIDPYEKLDLVVHSLKDLPTVLPPEFELGCITEREDPTDALCMAKDSPYKTLNDLPDGSVVGTSSLRRSAQLKKNFPNLRYQVIRGNVITRLAKLDDPETPFKCIVLATAGLKRLDLAHRITMTLNLDNSGMYHAVGQGALGIEIKRGNSHIKKLLQEISHKPTTICCLAERALMRTLEGGCSVPIGVETSYDPSTKNLTLKGIVISPNGKESVEDVFAQKINDDNLVEDSENVGKTLAHKLAQKGAKRILEEINFEKIKSEEELAKKSEAEIPKETLQRLKVEHTDLPLTDGLEL
ncbi:hydroxymethylbilane synthase [Saccharomycopsis crataegensis]|uniref:Porphobilinogen deaminase n=1 Tax=Saccharomycopsis crataegensis TaxID=43959 RepID=A0AAV5QKY2_9ASCO|nr:hydroxymethylbilane synthase [Saccharomycopsis crataegensis]